VLVLNDLLILFVPRKSPTVTGRDSATAAALDGNETSRSIDAPALRISLKPVVILDVQHRYEMISKASDGCTHARGIESVVTARPTVV
jgi:hypothetical protein